MDKVTCIAYLLYNSSKDQCIKEKAIQLLNGDVSIRDLKRDVSLQANVAFAESLLKKNKIDKNQVQRFADQFMIVEV
ncbi:hypothetical protein [Neobacillus sp. Marseille-QA0830]